MGENDDGLLKSGENVAGGRSAVAAALLGASSLGALSAFGDWLWYRFIPDGALIPAVIHGVVIFLALAAALAAPLGRSRAWRRLLLSLPILGFVLSAVFYPLAGLLGYLAALVLSWVLMWLGTAMLYGWARGGVEGTARVLVRGLLAALFSGLAFWAVSGMWTTPYGDDGPPIVRHFFYWSFAFLPGFLALQWGWRSVVPKVAPVLITLMLAIPAAGQESRMELGWGMGLLSVLAALAIYALAAYRQRRRIERERMIAVRERAISRRLRALDKLRDELLANTSEELRTPLADITAVANSLAEGAKGELPEAVVRDLEMITATGRRLAARVDDVLDATKLRDHSLELERRPVDLRPLVDVVLTVSRPLVGEKPIELENAVESGLPAAVADEHRLQQILLNLVGNAINFTESGKVRVSASRAGDQLELKVEDTGVGIALERHEKVFRSFEDRESDDGAGVGFGLVLARELVELHGGEIWVESAEGEGASFFFTLPIEAAGAADPLPDRGSGQELLGRDPSVTGSWAEPTADPMRARKEPEIATSGLSPDGESRFRILVADDEPVNQTVVSNFLSRGPYELDLVSSGEEALSRIEEQRPDLALLDIMMPRVSGYEVCRAIRESWPRFELPVIFLTAKGHTSDLVAGYQAGANDYLVKPISKDELLARVETHLELLRVHRSLERLVSQRTAQLEKLSGLLPICSMCKKIRDDDGYWREVEVYINAHTEAELSHGICPTCLEENYEFLTGEPRPRR